MSGLTTHVLDTSREGPAEGVHVTLKRIDDVEVSADHLEEMRGAMEYFDNLHQVREAYDRALETTRERRYH